MFFPSPILLLQPLSANTAFLVWIVSYQVLHDSRAQAWADKPSSSGFLQSFVSLGVCLVPGRVPSGPVPQVNPSSQLKARDNTDGPGVLLAEVLTLSLFAFFSCPYLRCCSQIQELSPVCLFSFTSPAAIFGLPTACLPMHLPRSTTVHCGSTAVQLPSSRFSYTRSF